MFYQTSGEDGKSLRSASLTCLRSLLFLTGATVVSWRVNNQEQLFVRWVLILSMFSFVILIAPRWSRRNIFISLFRFTFFDFFLFRLSVCFSPLARMNRKKSGSQRQDFWRQWIDCDRRALFLLRWSLQLFCWLETGDGRQSGRARYKSVQSQKSFLLTFAGRASSSFLISFVFYGAAKSFSLRLPSEQMNRRAAKSIQIKFQSTKQQQHRRASRRRLFLHVLSNIVRNNEREFLRVQASRPCFGISENRKFMQFSRCCCLFAFCGGFSSRNLVGSGPKRTFLRHVWCVCVPPDVD